MKSNPTSITAHHFHYHDTSMRSRCRMQTVKRFSGETDSSIKTKCDLSCIQVVIDCLRYRDQTQTLFGEDACNCQRTITTNCDECINVMQTESTHNFVTTVNFFHSAICVYDWIL